jgi:hypothetical protein
MQNSLGIPAPSPAPAGSISGASLQTPADGFQQPAQAAGTSQGSFQQSTPNPPGQSATPSGFQQSTQAPGQDTSQGSFQQSSAISGAPVQTMQQGGFQQTSGVPGGGIVTSCCGATLQKLEMAAGTFATDLPQFSGKFRNLNLTAGLQFINDLLQRTNALKLAINNLRQAPDKQSAAAALGVLSGQVNSIPADVNGGFVQDTSSAFPQQPAQTPMSFSTGAQPVNQLAGNQPSSAQPPAAQQPADQATNPVDQAEKAKKKLKDKLKKKIPW